MTPPKTPLRLRIEELLADGNWHPLEVTITTAQVLVPPGQAARRAETNRQAVATPGHPAEHGRVLGTEAAAVTVGQRDITRRTIHGAVTRGAIERSADGTHIRLTPTS